MAETILITGASRGIGLELANIFSDHNWNVLACCRHPDAAGDLKKLADARKNLNTYALDVTDDDAITRLAAGLEGKPIDILFNNAGIFGPNDQPFGNTSSDEWLDVMRTNVIALMKIAESFVDNVASSQRKIIASMGSMMGSIADNGSGGYYIYRSSKTALNMVVKSLSIDLQSRGITAVVFHPGWVKTDMGGPQAPTSPEESAAGLYRVLVNLTGKDNGRFLTFEGKELPW